jgi:hypothetical protein
MKIHRYTITADIEVEAENWVQADKAIRGKSVGNVRVIGQHYGIGREEHNRDWNQVKVSIKNQRIVRNPPKKI